jgi:hypothetical protein
MRPVVICREPAVCELGEDHDDAHLPAERLRAAAALRTARAGAPSGNRSPG